MSDNLIHPTAIIDPSAKIDPSTVIGPYTVIGPRVTIGKDNRIGPFCIIENTVMGDGNELIGHATIGVKPQDLSYDDSMQSMVEMGNGNKIRECVTIHRSTKLDVPTRIGNNCLLMANSHVAHDCQLGNNIILGNCTGVAGHVQIADRAIASGLVGMHQFVRIGRQAMISGGSMTVLDIPPYCTAQGERARLVGLNVIGMRRAGMGRDEIMAVKRAFKTLFRSKMLLKDAIAQLEAENPIAPVKEMLEFCKNTQRGIASVRCKNSDSDEE
ncbi:MAG: acyl-ACP--UDP-N-acetylglucosamine O-acyltransferase [Elusimicrobiaceae bacterium]|nr:acyl-ACP--UDP-N-acetylglucosamine O-acyltransferase [Elusimicrobiaceae bacterium]MBR5608975.1 acyl-ACP--UDP-N-acetylglucosamine O-acyltransferase [Elusimicrobiaceae bacterium]